MTTIPIFDPEKDLFAKHNGIQLISVEAGSAIARMAISVNHQNAFGSVQGGAIFTLADFAFAAAANSRGIPTVALNVSISYYKAPAGNYLIAKARELSNQNHISGFIVDVYDERDELIAVFNAIGYKRKPRP